MNILASNIPYNENSTMARSQVQSCSIILHTLISTYMLFHVLPSNYQRMHERAEHPVNCNCGEYDTSEISILPHATLWVFPEMAVPPKHPKMITFSRKTHGCWVPPFYETPISDSFVPCSQPCISVILNAGNRSCDPWEARGGDFLEPSTSYNTSYASESNTGYCLS